MLFDFGQFLMELILAGFILRLAQIKLAGTSFGKALSFLY